MTPAQLSVAWACHEHQAYGCHKHPCAKWHQVLSFNQCLVMLKSSLCSQRFANDACIVPPNLELSFLTHLPNASTFV